MKKQLFQSKLWLTAALGLGMATMFFSCKKSDEQVTVSTPPLQVGKSVSDSVPLTGSIKGTMLAGKTYLIGGNVTINKGDTLVIQPGVTVDFKAGNYSMIVRGNLFSLGSKEKPVYFTSSTVTKNDVAGAAASTDPAYQGTWGGILGDTSTKNMIIKWTHVEFGCGKLGTSPVYGIKNNAPAYMISFVNPNGLFVLEDSWVYGGVDDPIRIQGGRVHIMRNTFEKSGYLGGECLNIKSGTVGNVAYNLMMGPSTNGIKPSNNGGRGAQTDICAYNNTILNGGFRRASQASGSGRGGSINFEEGAKGVAFNNIMVNCLYGLRIIGVNGSYGGNALVGADTAHIRYGYNLSYTDTKALASQIYPNVALGSTATSSASGSNTGTSSYYTRPQSTDIPAPSSFLPSPYSIGQIYDGSAAVGVNNPKFVYYPLPTTVNSNDNISFATGYDFHLQSGSPAIGKGTTSFPAGYPLSNVAIDANFGATEVTPPSVDLGAYPTSGSGNKH